MQGSYAEKPPFFCRSQSVAPTLKFHASKRSLRRLKVLKKEDIFRYFELIHFAEYFEKQHFS
jgi:hypothetical protein